MQPLVQKSEQALLFPHAPAGEEARVDAIFDAIQHRLGFVPDGVRLYSFSPTLLETFMGNVSYFNAGGTNLPPELTAMIRYLVSWQAGCSFCVDMNEGFLTNMGKELDAIRAARMNPELAPLPEKEKSLLRLALKAVNAPEFVNRDDLDQARKQGWQDRDLFDAVVQAANNRAFNLVLRTFKIEHQGVYA